MTKETQDRIMEELAAVYKEETGKEIVDDIDAYNEWLKETMVALAKELRETIDKVD